jgi:TRAP-type C4-dicarboxylate transport system permease small subunit
MKDLLNNISKSLLVVPAIAFGLAFAVPAVQTQSVSAIDDSPSMSDAVREVKTDEMPEDLPAQIKKIISIILYVAGAIAVVMLIFGGVKYITSGGSQEKVAEAKNTILYAIVGIVVCLLSFAVVEFVISGISAT